MRTLLRELELFREKGLKKFFVVKPFLLTHASQAEAYACYSGSSATG